MRQAGVPLIDTARSSIIDPYLPFIRQTLEKFPDITASQLLLMVKERGYAGQSAHFRYLINRCQLRPKIEGHLPPSTELHLPLSAMIGEQAQVGWANLDQINIASSHQPLMAFVMVLSWFHHIFLRFFREASIENLLRGHVGAFDAWGGLPKVILYDNAKGDALERQENTIRIHPALLNFSNHYRFEPRLAKGSERNRIENTVRYNRESFFAALYAFHGRLA